LLLILGFFCGFGEGLVPEPYCYVFCPESRGLLWILGLFCGFHVSVVHFWSLLRILCLCSGFLVSVADPRSLLQIPRRVIGAGALLLCPLRRLKVSFADSTSLLRNVRVFCGFCCKRQVSQSCCTSILRILGLFDGLYCNCFVPEPCCYVSYLDSRSLLRILGLV